MKTLKFLALIFFLLYSSSGYAICGGSYSGGTYTGTMQGASLSIGFTTQFATSIKSLIWNGTQFIDSSDHGRELQSALSFDGYGECYNPTEAGSGDNAGEDGTGPTSSSIPRQYFTCSNSIFTSVYPAFWMRPGNSEVPCGYAVNTTVAWGGLINKKITVGLAGVADNIITFNVSIIVPVGESYSSGVFEVLTGYMPEAFNTFYTYTRGVLTPLSPTPMGEQSLPIIFATADSNYAMGVYAPWLPQSDFPTIGYGRFDFGFVVKWNMVYRIGSVGPGTYNYTVYVIIGTLAEVESSMSTLGT